MYLIIRGMHRKIDTELIKKGKVYPPISLKKDPSAAPNILPIPNPNCKYPKVVCYESLNKAGTME